VIFKGQTVEDSCWNGSAEGPPPPVPSVSGAYKFEFVCRPDGQHFEQILWQYKQYLYICVCVKTYNNKILLYFLHNVRPFWIFAVHK